MPFLKQKNIILTETIVLANLLHIYITFRFSNDEEGPSYSSTPAFFIDKIGSKKDTTEKHRGHSSGGNGSVEKRNSTLEVSETILNETRSTIDHRIKASYNSSKVSDQSPRTTDPKVHRFIISTVTYIQYFHQDVKIIF